MYFFNKQNDYLILERGQIVKRHCVNLVSSRLPFFLYSDLFHFSLKRAKIKYKIEYWFIGFGIVQLKKNIVLVTDGV